MTMRTDIEWPRAKSLASCSIFLKRRSDGRPGRTSKNPIRTPPQKDERLPVRILHIAGYAERLEPVPRGTGEGRTGTIAGCNQRSPPNHEPSLEDGT